MSDEQYAAPQLLHRLDEAFGKVIELVDDNGEEFAYYIKAEFQLGDAVYAALQTEDMRKEDEIDLFRVVENGDELQLESIDGEEEWEAACEAYDDLQFANEERP